MTTEKASPKIVVGIVPQGSSVLMLKRSKTEGNLQWNFPGGKVESREGIEAALKREILEETGLTCSVERTLGSRIHPDTGVEIHYFLCQEQQESGNNMEPEKADCISWVPAGEVPSLVTSSLFPAVAEYLTSIAK